MAVFVDTIISEKCLTGVLFFSTSNLISLDGKQQQLFPELKSKTAEELDYRIWQVSCE